MPPIVAIGPESDPQIEHAVVAGGGEVGPLERADALVWLDYRVDTFPDALPESVRWVQLPSAGVERWLAAGVIDGTAAQFTKAAGAFARSVAEHVLALLLAGVRALPACARAQSWGEPRLEELMGSTVVIVGAGGIGRELIRLLKPHDTEIVAVTRRGLPVEGAERTLPADRVSEVWGAGHVVLAAPSTAATRHLVDRAALAAMREDAWLVNVARGSLVDTDALVAALGAGEIGGAALDVTDPEPLPDGHPLWSEPRALITPHVANPPQTERRDLAVRVRENVARFAAGEPLLAPVDPEAGY
jgi:D-3-phosphoglycerate dehydrogenase